MHHRLRKNFSFIIIAVAYFRLFFTILSKYLQEKSLNGSQNGKNNKNKHKNIHKLFPQK